jgi:hypothetical protein
LQAAVGTEQLHSRAQTILSYMTDQAPPDEKAPLPFIMDMRQSRPYKVWVREMSNVTKEVFWIYIHHLNVVPLPASDCPKSSETDSSSTSRPVSSRGSAPPPRDLDAESYTTEFFPRQRPPVPAAPYVGGVEWDATNYVASHLDLLNGILASLPTRAERNSLRKELEASGMEKLMGGFLRTCKEKFYGSVHDGLRTWVAASVADGWDVRDVRMGPREDVGRSPRKSPIKKKSEPAPQIEAPKLDLGLGLDLEVKDVGLGQKSVEDWF